MTPVITSEPPRLPKDSGSSGSEEEWAPIAPAPKRRARPKVIKQAADTPDKADKASRPTNGSTSSIFRGVTRHVRTGRWESHIWHKNRQLYLGGFDTEHQAAMAYDMAVLNIKGTSALTNFDLSKYASELNSIMEMKEEDLVIMLRNKGKVKPTKTSSKYKGVTLHARRRWEARISCGQRRYKYLGLFGSEVEAAHAYDRAALAKDISTPTNFHISHYIHCLGVEQLQQACARGLLTEEQVLAVQQAQQQAASPTPPPVPPIPLPPIIAPAAAEPKPAPPLDDAAFDDDLEWMGSFDLEGMVAEIEGANAAARQAAAPLEKSVFGSGNLHIEDDPLLLDMDMGLRGGFGGFHGANGDDVLLQLVEMD